MGPTRTTVSTQFASWSSCQAEGRQFPAPCCLSGRVLTRHGHHLLCLVVLVGIKAIKLHAWEAPFLERMRKARAAELEELRCVAATVMTCTVTV